MNQTPEWLNRKYKQAEREKWEDSRLNIIEGMKSLALMIDCVFNKGRAHQDILPPTYEEALQKQLNKKEVHSKFVQGTWWKSE